MILGHFSVDREATFTLPVFDTFGNPHFLDAVIDTGFNGYLTLPAATMATLGLGFHSDASVTLADGARVILRAYNATVDWDGVHRDILVLEAEGGALAGISLLYGCHVSLDVLDGGVVSITPLP